MIAFPILTFMRIYHKANNKVGDLSGVNGYKAKRKILSIVENFLGKIIPKRAITCEDRAALELAFCLAGLRIMRFKQFIIEALLSNSLTES